MMESSVNRRMITRSKLSEETDGRLIGSKEGPKRSADHLPETGSKKRIFGGDITNLSTFSSIKCTVATKKAGKGQKYGNENSVPLENEKNLSSEDTYKNASGVDDQRSSTEDSTMYLTALEYNSPVEVSEVQEDADDKLFIKSLPEGVEDFDEASKDDPHSESVYAADIFKYYKEREKLFPVKKYLDRQKEITKNMRAVLVDWMVEVQESFELNHETLYLAVKLVDRYLMNQFVPKVKLQLFGATAIFVAAKFDERQPPLVDDFLYICDDSYSREQLIQTEIKILQNVNFDLGIPLSYRFLRRYARCSYTPLELLTLARYILEMSLMDYELIEVLDSKIAAGALLLALKMKKQKWTATHEYYSGYAEDELTDIVYALNKNISAPPNKHLQTIRMKYSHHVFFEVAKVPPLNL